ELVPALPARDADADRRGRALARADPARQPGRGRGEGADLAGRPTPDLDAYPPGSRSKHRRRDRVRGSSRDAVHRQQGRHPVGACRRKPPRRAARGTAGTGITLTKEKPMTRQVNIGIGEEERVAISEGLSRLLADTYTLYLTSHNFHWNVTG